MKTLARIPKNQVSVSELTHFNILGIKVCGEKYILTPIFNGGNVFFGWMNGHSRWSSAATINDLLAETFRDDRIAEITVFDSIKELTDWLNN